MKKIFIYVLLIFLILVFLSLIFINKNNKKINDLKILNNIDKKINYFNYDYIDRYISFKNKYTSLKDEDIVTRVNLNLDYPFYSNTSVSKDLNKIYILVNKYIYLPSNYVPNNLENISSKYALDDKLLVSDARINFEKMASDAKRNNLNIRAISAYRSYKYQEDLYNKYVKLDGKKQADTYSARAGFSEHQTGLVVDIDNINLSYEQFESTNEFEWMINNSYKYGFILRYPDGKSNITGYDYEAWHYRYVGKDIANYIHDHDLTFDEYYVRFIKK